MTLYDMLDKGMCYSTVWVYRRNKYNDCRMVFEGECSDARQDSEVWGYLLHDVGSYVCGDNGILIFLEVDEDFNPQDEFSLNVETRFRKETRLIK